MNKPEEIGKEFFRKNWKRGKVYPEYSLLNSMVIDIALKAERERIKKISKATNICECIDIHKCVICKAIDKNTDEVKG